MTSVNDIVIETDELKIEKIQLDEHGNLTADYSFEDKTYTVKMTSDEITQMSSELESKFVQSEDQDTPDANEEEEENEKERNDRLNTREYKEKARKMEFLKNICDIDMEAFNEDLIGKLKAHLKLLIDFLSKEITEETKMIAVDGKKDIRDATVKDLTTLFNGIPEYKEKIDELTQKIKQNNNEIGTLKTEKQNAAGGDDNSARITKLEEENKGLNEEIEKYTSVESIKNIKYKYNFFPKQFPNSVNDNNVNNNETDTNPAESVKNDNDVNNNETEQATTTTTEEQESKEEESTVQPTPKKEKDPLSIPKYLKDNVIEKDFEHRILNKNTISEDPFYIYVKNTLTPLSLSGDTKSQPEYINYYNLIVGKDKLIHSSIMILGNLMKLIQGLELYNTLLNNKHFENIKVSRISIQDDADKPRTSMLNTIGLNNILHSKKEKQDKLKSIMMSANNIQYSIQQINDAINKIRDYSILFNNNIADIKKSTVEDKDIKNSTGEDNKKQDGSFLSRFSRQKEPEKKYTKGYFFQAFDGSDDPPFNIDNISKELQDILTQIKKTTQYINPRKGENKLANIKGITKDTMQIPANFGANAKADATCEEALTFKPEEPINKSWFSGGNKRSKKKIRKHKHKATLKRK